MRHTMLRRLMMTGVLLTAGIAAAAVPTKTSCSDSEIAQKLAHEIRMYSRYTIWTTST